MKGRRKAILSLPLHFDVIGSLKFWRGFFDSLDSIMEAENILIIVDRDEEPTTATTVTTARFNLTIPPICINTITRTMRAVGTLGAALSLLLMESPPPSPHRPIPVLQIIQVYGKLAASECYGSKAPAGSSCQILLDKLENNLGITSATTTSISRQDFDEALQRLEFRWPLKPYVRRNPRKFAENIHREQGRRNKSLHARTGATWLV
jgi:hypothetical protein